MYRALIVSQMLEPRRRLQHLFERCEFLEKVDSAQSLDEAKRQIREPVDFIFISNNFEPIDTAKFIEAVRLSPAARKASLILVTHSDSEEPDDIANNMIVGIHGFLCEPLSVDKVKEVCGLAAGVQQQNSQTRLRAAAGLMLTGVMKEFEGKSEDFGAEPKNLWEKVQRSCDAYRTVTGESLTNVVVQKLSNATPSERVPNYDGVSKRVRMMFRERFRKSLQALHVNVKVSEEEPS